MTFKPNYTMHLREKSRIALVISAYQSNKSSSDLLRVALQSIIKFKREDACIWVVDVGSPASEHLVTHEEFPSVNFITTKFIPRSWQGTPVLKRVVKMALGSRAPRDGSYANGWTLQFAMDKFSEIEYKPEYMMTLQMDIMFTDANLLDDMISLFKENTSAVGVLKQYNYDKSSEILNPNGCLYKYEIISSLCSGFWPDLPKYDVGEKLIAEALAEGYDIASLPNTYNNEDLIENLEQKYKKIGLVDRCINADGNVVFMHLGRGIPKAESKYHKLGRTTPAEWIEWFRTEISQDLH